LRIAAECSFPINLRPTHLIDLVKIFREALNESPGWSAVNKTTVGIT
jgi:hypothetical protein